MFDLPLVQGHSIGGETWAFPHRCPGCGCAVAEFVFRKSLLNQMERQKAATFDAALAADAAELAEEPEMGV